MTNFVELLRALGGGDRYVRERAVEALEGHVESEPYDEKSTPVKAALMRALLRADHWWVRKAAAEALTGHVNNPEVQAAFVHLLRDGRDKYIRSRAADALKDHGNNPEVQEAFLQALRDGDSDNWCVRKEAAKALTGRVNEPEVQEALLHVLLNDADRYVREAAAEALKDHGNDPAVQAVLLHVLRNDGDIDIRQAAARALTGRVESDLCDEQSTPVKAVFVHLLRNDGDIDIRQAAAKALKDHVNDPAVQELLVEALLTDGPFVREIAAEALKDHVNEPAVKAAFVQALQNDDNNYSRWAAAKALAPHAARDPEINGVMVEAFKNDPDPEVRQVAAREADCSAADLTGVNFSDLPDLPQVDEKTTVIPPEWCQPKSGLVGFRNSLKRNKATSADIAETKARFEGVPPEELERFLGQLSTLQRFGLRMMLQQGQLPHTQRMNGRWDQPAVQFVDAAELLDIPKLFTDSAAVEQYLSDHHIGVAEGDHSNHRDYNGGKALPNTFRGAWIRDFNGNGRTMPKDLRGTWWNNATAIGADFQGSDLSDATLIGVDLSKANLSGVNLSGARLVNCNLADANLSGAIMDCTWIENCTITDSVMHGGVIQDVVVTASYINNLTLHGTDENPMMIKGLHLSDSVVLDYALMGNCHVQQIEVYSSAVVGQSNGHVPPEELDYCSLSYYADQPPLRGLSNLILPPNGMVVRQINCDRQVAQTGAIGSSLVLTVVDGNGQPIDDKPLLEHLAGVQIGYQPPKANRQPPLSSNPQLPPPRQHWPDVDAKHAAAPFQAFSQGATR
ncbi:MAG: hypothetical protein FGM23_04615 [Alphaproteobacteria bacterium]|nr:hypothetical protein [Alphaproteobacteria bacterium]